MLLQIAFKGIIGFVDFSHNRLRLNKSRKILIDYTFRLHI